MPFLILFLICLAFLVAFLKSPRGRGWAGEMRVKSVIGKTNPGTRFVINDFKFRVSENKTTQIDHILINRSGVFVIETKNYSGRIYGNEKSLEWTQVLNYGKVKNKLYNPIKQNKTHVYHISNILGHNIPIISAVVFVQGNIYYIEADDVYSLGGLRALIQSRPAVLSLEEMEALYNKLIQVNDKSITTAEHISSINSIMSNVSNNVCPRCGKDLVLRKGKNGNFMGCKGYPNCKFTKNI